MMQKLLTLCAFAGLVNAQAQVIFFVEEPASQVGSYAFTWAPPSSGWGTPDLLIPANAITDTLAFVDDGTADDSLGCNALVNVADITGKIAVVYRGNCEFGAKAYNAQQAGAVGVVIINNVAGAPVGMGAGAQGANVTIPVVMISQADGAAFRDDIIDGKVVAFIGNIAGQFANNLAIYKPDVRMAKGAGYPKLVAANASEFDVAPAAWVHNYGYDDQTGVTLNAQVLQGGSPLYDETSSPVDILAGDSAFITLPTFSQATYDGEYELNYATTSGVTDDFPEDNDFATRFVIDSVFSYGNIDVATNQPISTEHYRPTTSVTYFRNCVHFRDANASRMAAIGLYASATHSAGTTLEGDFLEATVYEWTDIFTGMSDPNFAINGLNEVGTGEYYYDSDLNGVTVYIPFANPVMLVNDQRYLFCVTTYSANVFLGYNTTYDYDENMTFDDQPTTVINNDGTWFGLGFGSDVPSALGVKMANFDVGVSEAPTSSDARPYPNPAVEVVQIPLKGFAGAGQLRILDMTGRQVTEERVNVTADGLLTVGLSAFGNGTYTFALDMDNGRRTTFRVVVSK